MSKIEDYSYKGFKVSKFRDTTWRVVNSSTSKFIRENLKPCDFYASLVAPEFKSKEEAFKLLLKYEDMDRGDDGEFRICPHARGDWEYNKAGWIIKPNRDSIPATKHLNRCGKIFNYVGGGVPATLEEAAEVIMEYRNNKNVWHVKHHEGTNDYSVTDFKGNFITGVLNTRQNIIGSPTYYPKYIAEAVTKQVNMVGPFPHKSIPNLGTWECSIEAGELLVYCPGNKPLAQRYNKDFIIGWKKRSQLVIRECEPGTKLKMRDGSYVAATNVLEVCKAALEGLNNA